MKLQEKLTANLALVPSTLGGGSHRHAGLILSDAKYFRGTENCCVTPTFTGSTPTIPESTTVQQEIILQKEHAYDI